MIRSLHEYRLVAFMRNLNLRLGPLVFAFIGCLVGGIAWVSVPNWFQHSTQDFEQCSEQAEMNSSSKNELKTLLAECDKQFVGRRKVGGGYTYYDALQNRQFDIAGPNPNREEFKYFDEQYTLYLETQKREMDAASSAERQNQIIQPNSKNDLVVGSISPPGPPIVITPSAIPIPRARSPVIPPTAVCEDSSLSCSWTKFSAGLRKFFGSNANENRT
jgi:hypothetical protein